MMPMHDVGDQRHINFTGFIAAFIFVVAVLWMLFTPAPYAIQSPGPTIDTLGEYRDITLIDVNGTETYPDDEGELLITTVVAAGGPGYPVNVAQAIQGWASSHTTVLPQEVLYPPNVTQEEMDASAQQQMDRSQHDATIMALQQLGIEVPVELYVAGVDEESAADGLLHPGDEIFAIETPDHGRVDIETYADLAQTLAGTSPETPVVVHFLRQGEQQDVTFNTLDDGHDGSMLGIYLNTDFDMPFEVDIEVDKVGGPSAGVMFVLGIMDLLSSESLVGDHIVAGTGTINLNGRVGPIGGIKQKMHGASRDGAEFFLAPGENCADVQGNIPSGLEVVRIDTVEDVVEVADLIRQGDIGDLPRC